MKKLGFGLMRLPHIGDDWSKVDMAKTAQMIDRYMEEGFTYFDTAYNYHGGQSERVFGELVAKRYPRDRFTVTSKMPVFAITKAEQYPEIFDNQLTACSVDFFDYYFLHAIGKREYPMIQEHKGFEFLMDRKREGKIRHIGFSFHDDAQTLEKILNDHPETEVVQLQLNYIDWEDESVQARKCYEVCVRHGVKVTVMEPLKGGALANLPETADARLRQANPAASQASWGIRYAASLEHVLVVLSGMSTMEQLEDNMSYMHAFCPLSETENAVLEETVRIIRDSIAIPCTACRYCVDNCPRRIAIPEYFALYNNQKQFGLHPGIGTTFDNLTLARGKPSECLHCGCCESHCPQHLPIMENLELVEQVFENR